MYVHWSLALSASFHTKCCKVLNLSSTRRPFKFQLFTFKISKIIDSSYCNIFKNSVSRLSPAARIGLRSTNQVHVWFWNYISWNKNFLPVVPLGSNIFYLWDWQKSICCPIWVDNYHPSEPWLKIIYFLHSICGQNVTRITTRKHFWIWDCRQSIFRPIQVKDNNLS